MTVRILRGDCREVLRTLPAESVHCVVTSPPYFNLRDYGQPGQIGLERSYGDYVTTLADAFDEIRRVLRSDGSAWLNLGDSYAGSWGAQSRGGAPSDKSTLRGNGHVGGGPKIKNMSALQIAAAPQGIRTGSADRFPGLKPKDLIGIPWRVAFEMQARGWWLRQWLPWVKRNPMPESTKDRPTTAVEIVFHPTKADDYFYDYDAVLQTMAESSVDRLAQDVEGQAGSDRANGGAKTNGTMKAVQRRTDKQRGHSRRHAGFNDRWDAMERAEQRSQRAFRNSDLFYASLAAPHGAIGTAEQLLALDVATKPFRESHYATFPPDLIDPLILAGCPKGGTILDPFGGAGTTGLVADRHGRDAILIEINPEYADMAERRIRGDAPPFAEVSA